MTPQDRISRLAQQIGDRLQNASQAPEDIQKGVQQVVREPSTAWSWYHGKTLIS